LKKTQRYVIKTYSDTDLNFKVVNEMLKVEKEINHCGTHVNINHSDFLGDILIY